jgi:hypothetical protein
MRGIVAPMPASRGQRGQASVEAVAVLPMLVILGFAVWQAAVAGQAMWLAGSAARAAARAEALGEDPAPAASRVLPPRLEDGLRVRVRGEGGVAVTVQIPAVIGGGTMASTTARARFVPQTS